MTEDTKPEDLEAAAQNASIQQAQQEAWATQQVEATYVNGFSILANLDGTTRLSFNEKTRADLPGSVRAALLLPAQVADNLIATLTATREKQKDAMPNKVATPFDDRAAGAVGG